MITIIQISSKNVSKTFPVESIGTGNFFKFGEYRYRHRFTYLFSILPVLVYLDFGEYLCFSSVILSAVLYIAIL